MGSVKLTNGLCIVTVIALAAVLYFLTKDQFGKKEEADKQ